MPRRARIDAAGARQHIIGHGIERRKIFRDDSDRQAFLGRLGRVLQETRSVLNPHCARLVESLARLDSNPYGGHSAQVIKRAAKISGLNAEQVRTAGKEPWRVEARSLGCYWAVREPSLTPVAESKVLGICPTAVRKAVCRR
jgi:hypothetical protein